MGTVHIAKVRPLRGMRRMVIVPLALSLTDQPAAASPGWKSCTNHPRGFSVDHPERWHEGAVHARERCRLFDPEPIRVAPNSEPPLVALQVDVADGSRRRVLPARSCPRV